MHVWSEARSGGLQTAVYFKSAAWKPPLLGLFSSAIEFSP